MVNSKDYDIKKHENTPIKKLNWLTFSASDEANRSYLNSSDEKTELLEKLVDKGLIKKDALVNKEIISKEVADTLNKVMSDIENKVANPFDYILENISNNVSGNSTTINVPHLFGRKVQFFNERSTSNPEIVDVDEIKINSQNRYITLDKIMDMFDLEPEIIESVLEKDQSKVKTFWYSKDSTLVPYFYAGDIRSVLFENGYKDALYNNISKNKKPSEIENLGEKKVFHIDLVKEDESGVKYGRASFWSDLIGFSRGRLSKQLDMYEDKDVVKNNMIADVEYENNGKLKRTGKNRFLNHIAMQYIVDNNDVLCVEDNSKELERDVFDKYHSIYAFAERFTKDHDFNRSQGVKFGTIFRNQFLDFDSYSKTVENVRFKVYHEDDAKRAYDVAINSL